MAEEFHKFNRTQNVKRNLGFGILNNATALLFPFIVRTVLIYKFGVDYLGLNGVFSSILQVLNLAELGFGTAVVYSLYEPVARDDTETICAYLSTYRKVYRIMGLGILALGLCVMPFLRFLIRDAVVPGGLNLYIWFSIYLADTVISYLLYAYKLCLPTAFQRIDLISKVDMVVMAAKSIIQIIVLLTSRNFYLYLIVFPVMTVVRNLLMAAMTKRRYPQYECRGSVSDSQWADLKRRVTGLMINRFCLISRNGIDSICISAFLGLTITGIYHSYFYIFNALVAISLILQSAMTPGVGNSIVTESKEKNYADMRRFSFIYMMIVGWTAICMLCLYQPFVRVWLGANLMLPLAAVIALSLYFYVLKMLDMRWYYSEAAGLWWEYRYWMIAETVANVILNILFVHLWGVTGIIAATIVSILLINFIGSGYVIFKYYFQNGKLGEFFTDHARYFLVTLGIAVVTFFACRGIGHILPSGKWIQLFVRIPVSALLPVALYYVFYGRTEAFREAFTWIRSKIGRRGSDD